MKRSEPLRIISLVIFLVCVCVIWFLRDEFISWSLTAQFALVILAAASLMAGCIPFDRESLIPGLIALNTMLLLSLTGTLLAPGIIMVVANFAPLIVWFDARKHSDAKVWVDRVTGIALGASLLAFAADRLLG